MNGVDAAKECRNLDDMKNAQTIYKVLSIKNAPGGVSAFHMIWVRCAGDSRV